MHACMHAYVHTYIHLTRDPNLDPTEQYRNLVIMSPPKHLPLSLAAPIAEGEPQTVNKEQLKFRMFRVKGYVGLRLSSV